nr:MAG TPA: hypothetical protein [Caudoviricetes sp.]
MTPPLLKRLFKNGIFRTKEAASFKSRTIWPRS